MKRQIILFCLFVFAIFVNAQTFEPTTKWPYLYKDFQSGTIFLSKGTKTTMTVNVHLLKSSLQYLKDELIYQADSKDVIRVEIGADQFIYIDGELAKILEKNGKNYLLSITKGDFDALTSGTGAYGTSAQSSATTDLSSMEIGGLSNMNHKQLVFEKEDGKILPLKTEYYFVIDGKPVLASKKEIIDFVDVQKKAQLNTFLKENRIKWKNKESLSKLLLFFK